MVRRIENIGQDWCFHGTICIVGGIVELLAAPVPVNTTGFILDRFRVLSVLVFPVRFCY